MGVPICFNLIPNNSHKGTKLTKDTEENKEFFLISKLLNHKNTEINIGIYKLSPKLRVLRVLRASVRDLMNWFFLKFMMLSLLFLTGMGISPYRLFVAENLLSSI